MNDREPMPTLRAAPALDAGAPVLTAAEMRAWDAHTTERMQVPEPVLMEAAARAVAHVVQREYPEGPVVAAVGRGNNGGDALVLLRTLLAWGREVAALPVEPAAIRPELLHGWSVPVPEGEERRLALATAGVVVDGLLGTGARGAPRPAYAELIREVNASGRPVVALDGPSGVEPTDGSIAGEAVRADLTVALGALKRGHLRWPGRAHAGRIVVVEIGLSPLPAGGASALLVTPALARARLGRVPANAHKGTMGDVVVVAGSAGVAGAALLAGTAAARGGAGKVWLVSDACNRTALQIGLPEAIFVDRGDADGLYAAIDRADALVVGPGMGTDAAAGALLAEVLRRGAAPLVLDADALTLLAADSTLRELVARREVLLTPHPAEMARLLETTTGAVLDDPFASAAEAARRFGAAVLLKGFPSLVAARDEPVLVGGTGHAGVATGGMGDTLAGVAGALLAFGLGARDAAATALHLCGRAAELAGRGRALLPRDVAERLADAMEVDPPPPAPGVLLDLPAPR